MRVLLTGASGFVGSHVLRHLLTNTDWDVVCPVSFGHKGLPRRIASAVCDTPHTDRVTVIHWDMRSFADLLTRRKITEGGPIDVIMNVASESHVDRSIENPVPFVENNISLMLRVLELARTLKPGLFLQMSTDEVYGPAPEDYAHKEWDPPVPSNPYSASKAAQEAIAISYWRTYGVPLVLTNTMNIIGEMQDPEKFVPLIMRKLLNDEPIHVHCDTAGHPGSRFYLHARNLADAWLHLTEHYLDPPYAEETTFAGEAHRIRLFPEISMYGDGSTRPDRYHIVGEREVDNIEMVHMIARFMGYPVRPSRIERIDFHGARPGHDLRYALDGSKIRRTGWYPPVPLDTSLKRTVEWTMAHPEWLET